MTLGMGAILHQLGGGSPKNASDYYGRKIVTASLDNDEIKLGFDDNVTIRIWDDGQSCCESRYITCDDDIKDLIGKKLTKIEVKNHKEETGEYEEHEMAFVEINAEGSSITFCTHNQHNGYYGGFGLSLDVVE